MRLTLLLLFINVVLLKAQFYETGQDPASIRWNQIRTEHVQVIFPEEIEEEAQHFANTMEYLYDKIGKTLKEAPPRISVLLHNQSIMSNGFVAWAPKRMECYAIPPQELYPQDWMEQLAIHETRHVVQVGMLNQGFTRFLYVFFGEQVVGAIAGLLPNWYYEGDAIAAETAFSNYGRGRLPEFEKDVKTLVTERDKLFSYEKAIHGSYKDFVPDHYHYGFYLTTYAKEKYGEGVWGDISRFTARNPYLLTSYWAFKKYTRVSKRKFYKEALYSLRNRWNDVTPTQVTNAISWNEIPGKDYVNYSFPVLCNDSMMIAEKSGLAYSKHFVMINKKGEEKKLFVPGFYESSRLSLGNGFLVWSEIGFDPRWENRNYYVIKIFNLQTHQLRTLARKTRYLAPSITSDGKRIVAVAFTNSTKNYLAIIDVQSGKQTDSIAVPAEMLIQHPSWDSLGQKVVMTIITPKGKGIVFYNVADKSWSDVVVLPHPDIAHPVFYKNNILFVSAFSGIDNIYALNIYNQSVFRITHSAHGAYTPSVAGNKLFYSDYTLQGKRIKELELSPGNWEKIEDVSRNSINYHEVVVNHEKSYISDTEIPDIQYPVRKYSKLGHLLNVHSWAPAIINYDDVAVEQTDNLFALSLLSQNMLGTMTSITSYAFNENGSYFSEKLTYAGFYPVIDLSVEYGVEPEIIYSAGSPAGTISLPDDHLKISSSVYLPLNFTSGKYIRKVTPMVSGTLKNSYLYASDASLYKDQPWISYKLAASNLLKKSYRDIFPRLGQHLEFQYYHSPFQSDVYGSLLYGKFEEYLPGLLKHHSIKLGYAYQKHFPASFSMPLRIIDSPRGLQYYVGRENHLLRADYTMPLCYPDANLGSYLYIKRIQTTFFYDYSFTNDLYFLYPVNLELSSIGMDITSEFFPIHLIVPFNLGARIAYSPELDETSVFALFYMNLNDF